MLNLDIVIVNWNSGDMLRECLSSFRKEYLQGIDLQLIVIDNHSSDDSLNGIENIDVPLTIVKNNRNIGFGAACNQGARLGKSDHILFLNPDTRLTENSIKPPLQFVKNQPHIGIIGIQLCDENGNVQKSCARFPSLKTFASLIFGWDRVNKKCHHFMLEWDHSDSREVDQVMGAYFLVRRNMFEQLKGFDERFFVYFEETDFSYRCHQRGYESYYYSSSQIFHVGQGTTKNIKSRRLYYSIQSRIKYFAKHNKKIETAIIIGLSLFVEPLTRIGFLLIKGSRKEAVNVLRAYKMIYKNLNTIL